MRFRCCDWVVLTLVLVAGCTGSAPPETPSDTGPETNPATSTPSASAEMVKTPSVSESSSDQKWLGEVPYDVFFDQPLTMVDQPPELGAVSVAAIPTPATGPTVSASTATLPSTGDVQSSASWSNTISGEVLDEESKVLRTRLTANLQRVATYNRSTDAITSDALIFAAIAGVAERYDGEMRWKDRAPAVRHLAYAVYENAGDKGRKAFDATQRPFEQLVSVLDGGPTDDIDFEAQVPFGDYAAISDLMVRSKQSLEWLKGSVASEALLKSERDAVVREASVLALIGALVQQPSYDYAEEQAFQNYARDFADAALAVRDAGEQTRFDEFQNALRRVQTSCGACHSEYAFEGDGL